MEKEIVKKEARNKKISTRKWYLIDAENKILGRLAVKVADLLRGRNKPDFSYREDKGSFVIIVNTDKIKVTGRKMEQKVYQHHTGYLGHLKTEKLSDLMENRSEEVLRRAVIRMLPKNKLQAKVIKRLKMYKKAEHNHKNNKEIIKYDA